MTATFRASAAVVDVTPPVGFPLGGYAFRSGVSTGVLDPIMARLLLVTTGDDALLLISLDWVYIGGLWTQGLRKAVERETGISGEAVIVTATHTHSGPGVFKSFITESDDEPDYLSGVSEKIVGAAGTLLAASREVTPLFGLTGVAGFGAHRNDPELQVDGDLSLLTFRGTDDTVVGRIIAYGCHPTLLGPENLLFSADWVGRGLSAVDRLRGGVSLFINGASGDVSTRFTRQRRGIPELERYAGMFGEAVVRAEKGSVPISETGITVRRTGVPVAYRELPDQDEARRRLKEIETAIGDLGKMGGAPPGRMRRLESMREAAIISIHFSAGGGFEKLLGERPMTATITLVRIGRAGIIFFPGEVMSGTALSLKAAVRGNLAVCGYADDYFGYLVNGGSHYESSMALLSPDSIEGIIGAAERLIEEVM